MIKDCRTCKHKASHPLEQTCRECVMYDKPDFPNWEWDGLQDDSGEE